MARLVSVFVTFASAEEAERIGRGAVETGLAACVNILGAARSIYRWEGAVEEAAEVAAIFKTTEARFPDLRDAILAQHSYDTPAIVAWPIEATTDGYAAWIEESVAPLRTATPTST